jgi:nucleoid DNA-binding protein
MAKNNGMKASSTTESKPRTKSQIFSDISADTGLSKKEVASVFDAMTNLIKKDLKKGPGTFTVPGLMKIQRIHKPKRPERKGINPFTGQEQVFKAKPAHNVVKVRPLKNLKSMV